MHLLMEITTFISIKRCINYWQDYKKTVLPSLMMILIGFGHFLSVLRPVAHSAWNHMIFSIKAWNSVSSTTESGELLLDIDLWPLIFFFPYAIVFPALSSQGYCFKIYAILKSNCIIQCRHQKSSCWEKNKNKKKLVFEFYNRPVDHKDKQFWVWLPAKQNIPASFSLCFCFS